MVKLITESGDLSWSEIRHKARTRFNRTCLACRDCNGFECRGQIPGVGGIGSGEAFIKNVTAIRSIEIATRVIHDVTSVDTSTNFLGRKLSIPLAAAPITGCDINLGGSISELDYLTSIMKGCSESGIIGFTGDGASRSFTRLAWKQFSLLKVMVVLFSNRELITLL
jgi:4-hydroxymandelate oxidase